MWHRNPWALGNLFNHPPFGGLPHCVVIPFSYPEAWLSDDRQAPLLPHAGSAQMGLAFWSIRPINVGEEAWFDYRLSPVVVESGDDIDFQYPHWYHPVDPEAVLADVLVTGSVAAGSVEHSTIDTARTIEGKWAGTVDTSCNPQQRSQWVPAVCARCRASPKL